MPPLTLWDFPRALQSWGYSAHCCWFIFIDEPVSSEFKSCSWLTRMSSTVPCVSLLPDSRLWDRTAVAALKWRRRPKRRWPSSRPTSSRTGMKSWITSWPLSATSGRRSTKTTASMDKGRGKKHPVRGWACRRLHGRWSFSKAWVIFLWKAFNYFCLLYTRSFYFLGNSKPSFFV